MTSRQRLAAVFAGQVPDRVPMVDISYWPATVERRRQEGLPDEVSLEDCFGRDVIGRVSFDCSLQLPARALGQTADFCITVDANGVTTKSWLHRYAPSAQLGSTIAPTPWLAAESNCTTRCAPRYWRPRTVVGTYTTVTIPLRRQ